MTLSSKLDLLLKKMVGEYEDNCEGSGGGVLFCEVCQHFDSTGASEALDVVNKNKISTT